MGPQAALAQTTIEGVQKKLAMAMKDHAKKAEAEANAHIEARERKAADAIISVSKALRVNRRVTVATLCAHSTT